MPVAQEPLIASDCFVSKFDAPANVILPFSQDSLHGVEMRQKFNNGDDANTPNCVQMIFDVECNSISSDQAHASSKALRHLQPKSDFCSLDHKHHITIEV